MSLINDECPICMEAINENKNIVVTECGHHFHCSCLMKNTAHNGFGCPYCRKTMAEEPELSDEDDDDYYIEDEQTIIDDDILTTFRMFHQRINGEEIEEIEENDWETVDENENENDVDNERPAANYVARILIERGVTFEDLIKNILFQEHSNLGEYYTDYERRSAEIYGAFRIAFNRYRCQQNEEIN